MGMGKLTPFTLNRGFSERSKEFDCKSNAISFVGSNPTSTTILKLKGLTNED
jgi:hypothetical protein